MSATATTSTLDKIILVTRKTRLQELVERLNSRMQAKFYIEHAGGDFSDYEREDDAYRRALETLRRSLAIGLKMQLLDRSLLPTFLVSDKDLVVTLGQDGLVANAAKYVGDQPIVAVNPQPDRFDGILLPFLAPQARDGCWDPVGVDPALLDSVLLDFTPGGRNRMKTKYLADLFPSSIKEAHSGLLFVDYFQIDKVTGDLKGIVLLELARSIP